LAAIVDVRQSIEDPLLTDEVNVNGTLNLLEACRKRDVELMVYASSCALYGDAGKTRVKEDTSPRPVSPYATSKLAAENYCLSFHKTYGLPVVSLRFFNIYGPRQIPGPYAGVVAKFVHRLLRNRPPVVYGNGKQSRDFLSVKDAVNACMLSLGRRKALEQVINIGSGKSITINHLAKLLIKTTGRTSLRPVYHPFREGEILHSRANIQLAQRVLGYTPTVPLKKGLRQYVDWIRSVHEY
jgi:UDP-glucose 4-epimerase